MIIRIVTPLNMERDSANIRGDYCYLLPVICSYAPPSRFFRYACHSQSIGGKRDAKSVWRSPLPDHCLDRVRRKGPAIDIHMPELGELGCNSPKDFRSPVLGLRRRSRFTSATSSGFISTCDLRPSHLPSRARLRSRAALSLATVDAFSNCAMAPSTCRTRTAVGCPQGKNQEHSRDEVDA
jgi:hypothetical protein